MNIFYWNCRGLGKTQRKHFLKYYLIDHKINLLGIQETN
jgi:hypothetical protein